MMGLNTFLEQRQIAERNKFAQQELDQRAKRDASLDRYYDAQASAMERNADTNRMKAEQKKYQYKQLKNGGVAIFEGGKLLKVAERPEDFTGLALSLADTDEEKAYARSDPEGFIEFKGQSGAKLERAKASATKVSNLINTVDDPYLKELAKGQGEQFTKSREVAKSAVKQITSIHEARRLLDAGVFTGAGANLKLALGKALKVGGINFAEDDIANTEAFVASIGRQTLELVKGLGAGTGISNADRDYAERIAGGQVALDENAIRKILDINERAAKEGIKSFNGEASIANEKTQGRLGDLSVKDPGDYAPPAKARKIMGDSDYDNLPSGSYFYDPQGNLRRKP
jgi:hypothetical protein